MLQFSPIRLEEKERYYAYWEQTSCRSIDYTLPNLFGWKSYFGVTWACTDTLCWLKQENDGPLYWAPIGPWERVDWTQELANLPKPATFIRVPEALLTLWQAQLPTQLTVEESRGQWEYLYKREDLAALAGRHFHKKKNLVSNYIRSYGEPDYRPLSDNLVEDVLGLEDEWCQWHECQDSPSLQAENAAINTVLSHCDAFRNLEGGALYVDDRMVAFSIGEVLTENSIGVHYEKGLLGYKGIYQTINREFAKHTNPNCTLINRAQDLDEEGLRAAKMSYNPVDFIKKWRVTIS